MGLLDKLFGREPKGLRLDFKSGHDAYWLNVGKLPEDFVHRFHGYGNSLAELAHRKATVPFVVSEPRPGAFGRHTEELQSAIYTEVAVLIGTVEPRVRQAIGDGYVCFVLGETADNRRHVGVVVFDAG